VRQTHRAAYLALTGVVAAVGGTAATIGGADAKSMIVGLLLAWAVQAASFWPLAGALEAGRPIVVPWVAGMAARFGGLAVLWAVSALAGRGSEVVLAYAFSLVTFLLLEAAWLAVVTRGAMSGTEDL
jgi:hypothetical protein